MERKPFDKGGLERLTKQVEKDMQRQRLLISKDKREILIRSMRRDPRDGRK